jgi:hypothetical protein
MSDPARHVTGPSIDRTAAIAVRVGVRTSDILSDDDGHDSHYVPRQPGALAAGEAAALRDP